ncbi:MAG TPA: hypothetical protein VFY71_17310 [Planctomycetota bacterium]|nr:hypothetical protein [Planctomycetota bacterium]
MMLLVIDLRKTPLFLRIGLMWWVVLLAWEPSRRFILFEFTLDGLVGSTGLAGSPRVLRAGISLAEALASGWVVVRWMRSSGGAGKSTWGLLGWSVLLSLFAVVTWWIVLASTALLELGEPLGERLGRVLFGLWQVVYVPWLAFTHYWGATWIVVPLAVATVLIVRTAEPSREQRGAGGHGDAAAPVASRSTR